jgi:hypothetical protein
MTARKVTVWEPCGRHAPQYASATRARRAEVMLEGGWAGPCEGGRCRMRPGTDFYTADFVAGNPVYRVGTAPREAPAAHVFSEEADAVYPHLKRARCSCGWRSSGYSKFARHFWDSHLRQAGAVPQ